MWFSSVLIGLKTTRPSSSSTSWWSFRLLVSLGTLLMSAQEDGKYDMSGSTHTSHDVNAIHNISKQTRDDARTMKMLVMVVAVVEPANDPLVTIGRKTGFLYVSSTTRVGPWLGIHDSKVLNVHFFVKHCLCPVACLDRAYVGANGNHALPGHEEANHPTNEGWDVLL